MKASIAACLNFSLIHPSAALAGISSKPAAYQGGTVFELGKDIIRTNLPIPEACSGKKIMYQDEEAKKSGKGN